MPDAKDEQFSKRFSISFNREQVEALEQLAKQNDVSVSWFVRLAVSEFVTRHRDRQLKLDFSQIESVDGLGE